MSAHSNTRPGKREACMGLMCDLENHEASHQNRDPKGFLRMSKGFSMASVHSSSQDLPEFKQYALVKDFYCVKYHKRGKYSP